MPTAMPVTDANFEAPWSTPIIRYGVGGLVLNVAPDVLRPEDAAILTNLAYDATGYYIGRYGQTSLATAGAGIHSIGRLDELVTFSWTRVWGAGTNLLIGQTGALTTVDTGYSGDPLSLLPYRASNDAGSWMFVANAARMRKVRIDGLDVPIGLPVPGGMVSVTPETPYQTGIAAFDGSDGTQAAAWFPNAGTDFFVNETTGLPEYHPTVPPLISDQAGAENGTLGGSVRIDLNGGPGISTSYYTFMSLAKVMNLTTLTNPIGPGTRPADDPDLMHLWLKTSHPSRLKELRLYLVCDAVFDTSVVPGTSQLSNVNAYVKAFRPDDFTTFISGTATAVEAAQTSRTRAALDADLRRRRTLLASGVGSAVTRVTELVDTNRQRTLELGAGNEQWMEYGVVGLPLRRGDFRRIGNSPDRSWATITGIIIYVLTTDGNGIGVEFDAWFLSGGSGPDSVEPGAQPYDYRATHYDPRTGAESNGCDEAATPYTDLERQGANVSVAAYGSGAIRQRFYRRGGSLVDDWYFVGESSSDGGTVLDRLTDAEISADDLLPVTHYQPVPSQDDAGNEILAQPVPVLIGPVQDLMFAVGDPNRPGVVYYCLPGEPDHWPADGWLEVCSPTEELMNGGLFSGQAFVFSRERLYYLYPNLTQSGTVSSSPTGCKKGINARWFFTVGRGGIYFGTNDGIYRTGGDDPTLISRDIEPLFRGETVNGYFPIDFLAENLLRLEVFRQDLWFSYRDSHGDQQVLLYSLLDQKWRHYAFGNPIVVPFTEGANENAVLILGANNGSAYTHAGTSDAGIAIAWTHMTGALDAGQPRKTKLLGDIILDLDRAGTDINVLTTLNHDAVINGTTVIDDGTGRTRYIIQPFGSEPQQARTCALTLSGNYTAARPVLYQAGIAISLQPDVLTTRPTVWDDAGHPYEKYVKGVVIEANTGGQALEIVVEYDLAGGIFEAARFFLTCDGRHKRFFSWVGPDATLQLPDSNSQRAVKANLLRIRALTECAPWQLYKVDYIFDKEPARIATWDTNWENHRDSYYTGLDIECDTFGLAKQVEVWIDQVRITDPETSLSYFTVTAAGRRYVHLTFGPARGHVYRFVAIDTNPGLLYSHKWWIDAEPSEQHNWNQNYSILGTMTDKWMKGVLLQCDTFGEDKLVQVQIDGVSVETLTVNTPERRVVMFGFPKSRGRVIRILPVDHKPGRLYSWQPVFDEEPLALTWWETEELTLGVIGFKSVFAADIVIRSVARVIMTVVITLRNGTDAATLTQRYFLPSTNGVKQPVYVPFSGNQGVLYKFTFQSDDYTDLGGAFWLYRAESKVEVQARGSAEATWKQPFGDHDLDLVRAMQNAQLTAERGGGGEAVAGVTG
jgi:hypothetical protein